MSVALIEPFDRWFLSLSKDSGTVRRNDCYTKCGGFDKLNHRNANLLNSPFFYYCSVSISSIDNPVVSDICCTEIAPDSRSFFAISFFAEFVPCWIPCCIPF